MLAAAVSYVPYPSWLNPGDNTWQMTAATFVGLMSLPGLAVLYASIVPKKWAVNVLGMMFAGFSLVMLAWFLWAYKMGFGANSFGGGVKNGIQTQFGTGKGFSYFIDNFLGKPGPIVSPQGEQSQAISAANTIIPFHFPTASLAYFQLVFAAITPLLFLGACSGGSSSAPGASWCRCGRPASTRSTPSCCGAEAISPRRVHSTSPAGMSSTCPPACRASSRRGSSVHGCCVTDNTSCPTTWSWRRLAPASCGSVGTASTVVTRTTQAPARRARWSTPICAPPPVC